MREALVRNWNTNEKYCQIRTYNTKHILWKVYKCQIYYYYVFCENWEYLYVMDL